jgi:hypothetical protein
MQEKLKNKKLSNCKELFKVSPLIQLKKSKELDLKIEKL